MMDVDSVIQGGSRWPMSFYPRAKNYSERTSRNEPQIEGIKFILPLLHTVDFFSQPEEMYEKWFGLFDLYVNGVGRQGAAARFQNRFGRRFDRRC